MLRRLVSWCSLVAALALLAACAAAGAGPARQVPVKRTLYMSAVEYKGTAGVEKEPFPAAAAPAGSGYVLKAPADGQWQASTYRFEPGLIVVNQGDTVELQIWGVNGAQHPSTIEGYDIPFVVRRGQLTTLTFTADKAGIFRIICHSHTPSMQAQLLVLGRQ